MCLRAAVIPAHDITPFPCRFTVLRRGVPGAGRCLNPSVRMIAQDNVVREETIDISEEE